MLFKMSVNRRPYEFTKTGGNYTNLVMVDLYDIQRFNAAMFYAKYIVYPAFLNHKCFIMLYFGLCREALDKKRAAFVSV